MPLTHHHHVKERDQPTPRSLRVWGVSRQKDVREHQPPRELIYLTTRSARWRCDLHKTCSCSSEERHHRGCRTISRPRAGRLRSCWFVCMASVCLCVWLHTFCDFGDKYRWSLEATALGSLLSHEVTSVRSLARARSTAVVLIGTVHNIWTVHSTRLSHSLNKSLRAAACRAWKGGCEKSRGTVLLYGKSHL